MKISEQAKSCQARIVAILNSDLNGFDMESSIEKEIQSAIDAEIERLKKRNQELEAEISHLLKSYGETF